MTRKPDEHFTVAELQALAAQKGRERMEASGHLRECALCREALQLQADVGGGIPQYASVMECPHPSVWADVANSALSTDEIDRLMLHASSCTECTHLLQQSCTLSVTPPSANEALLLDELRSGTADWQHSLANRLAATTRPIAKSNFRWSRLWLPAAAVATLVVAAFLIFSSRRATNPAALLDQAYAQNRTLDLRIGDAAHSELKVERGGKSVERPSALLQAELEAQRQLEKTPDNAAALHAAGRADLLEWDYEKAIDRLTRSLQLDARSPMIKMDLASAYYERGASQGLNADYVAALDLLGQVLAGEPRNKIALFNRAIVSERLGLYHQSIKDWDTYLQVDNHGAWADEARRRRDAVQKKISEHDAPVFPGLSPSQVATISLPSGCDTPLDTSAEDYQQRAIVTWLPAAFVLPVSSQSEQYRFAIVVLSSRLRVCHKDEWLEALFNELQHSERIESARLAVLLSTAAEATQSGDLAKAMSAASEAIRRARNSHLHAALLGASWYRLYAAERASAGRECEAEAKSLVDDLHGTKYAWLVTQAHLELFNCMVQTTNTAGMESALSVATEWATRHDYPQLRLRAIGFVASMKWVKGDFVSAWQSAHDGIEFYWAHALPPAKAHHLLGLQQFIAEDERRDYAALLFAREALGSMAAVNNKPLEALAHYRLAQAAHRTGNEEEAKQQFAATQAIVNTLPPDRTMAGYRGFADIGLLEILSQTDLVKARAAVSKVENDIRGLSNDYLLLLYYNTIGMIDLRCGDLRAARNSFSKAVERAELGLRPMRTQRERFDWAEAYTRAYRSLASVVWQQGNPKLAFAIWEHHRAPEASVRQGGAPTSELLPDKIPELGDRLLISYMQTDDGVLAWAIDSRGYLTSKFIRVPERVLQDLVYEFLYRCSTPLSPLTSIHQLGAKLYDMLVSPLTAETGTHINFVIEPDGSISQLPFEALTDPSGHYLGEGHTIVFSPGWEIWRRLKAGRVMVGQSRALIVALPTASGKVPTFDVIEEADTIASQLPHAEVLKGPYLNAAVLRKRIPKVAIMHIAAHAQDNSQQHSPDIQLQTAVGQHGGESLLTVLEQVRPIRCRLAVLSACSTAASDRSSVLYSDPLIRTLLASGVSHVIATRWAVDSHATLEYMRSFYGTLSDTDFVSIAMSRASQTLRASGDTRHPYYWASFQQFGRE
jgi:CHAT domain-containing protein/tetratricopeptide (TPR) repeat protein